jgi:hypothetical protein
VRTCGKGDGRDKGGKRRRKVIEGMKEKEEQEEREDEGLKRQQKGRGEFQCFPLRTTVLQQLL